ncbi:CHASE2 domain-containing protein [Catalinimonas sp. 4WD22]|uniref:CHASE2 domain-containing protein n=1 Tax=Catalinimonas locisalis TaxID=3133978 RepID=UPI003100DCFE
MKKGLSSRHLWLVNLFCLFHAFLLVGATVLLINIPFLHPSALDIAKYNTRFKTLLDTYLFKNDTTSLPYNFAFVDVAWSKKLVPKYDSLGIQIGNKAITDRETLVNFFRLINSSSSKPKLILCDIFFEEATQYDSLLQKEFDQLDNLIIPIAIKEDQIIKPVVTSDFGLATVLEHRGNFLKYRYIFSDTLRQLPLVGYEKIRSTKYKKAGSLLRSESGKYFFNNFIPTLRISPFDLNHQNGNLLHLYIDELLAVQDIAATFLQDRIVIVGDFENLDRHQTLWGEMSGALIIANALLALEYQDNLISWLFLLFLFICYVLITYFAILPKPWLKRRALMFRNRATVIYRQFQIGFSKIIQIKKKKQSVPTTKRILRYKITSLLVTYITYALFLELVNLIAFFWLNIHLTPIFYLSTWFWLIELASGWVRKHYSIS